jgi:RND family efflux transporter MFP subunit
MKTFTTAAVLAAVILMNGCGHGTRQEPLAAAAKPSGTVSLATVVEEDLPTTVDIPGTVRAAVSTTLAARVIGHIREVRVRPGDRVAANQVVVVIDARDLESMLLQAKAAEREAHSGVAEADNAIALANAQLVLARSTFGRMENLYAAKSISTQEFEEAQAKLRTAEAAKEMAMSRRAQLDSRIEQAKQGSASADVQRTYAEVRTPFAGIVTEKKAEAGQMATPGAPLLTIEQTGRYRLEAPVEEALLGQVRVGDTVSVALDSSELPVAARITEIVPAIDAASRSFLVKATLPAMAVVRSGMFGRLRIKRGIRSVVLIPAGAISKRGDLENVMVVEEGIARTRMISTGVRQDGRVEVLSGLQKGEKVVHPLAPGLTDGAKVEVR